MEKYGFAGKIETWNRGVVTTQYGCFAHMFPKDQSIEITLQTFAIVLANFQVLSGGVTPSNNGFMVSVSG